MGVFSPGTSIQSLSVYEGVLVSVGNVGDLFAAAKYGNQSRSQPTFCGKDSLRISFMAGWHTRSSTDWRVSPLAVVDHNKIKPSDSIIMTNRG